MQLGGATHAQATAGEFQKSKIAWKLQRRSGKNQARGLCGIFALNNCLQGAKQQVINHTRIQGNIKVARCSGNDNKIDARYCCGPVEICTECQNVAVQSEAGWAGRVWGGTLQPMRTVPLRLPGSGYKSFWV